MAFSSGIPLQQHPKGSFLLLGQHPSQGVSSVSGIAPPRVSHLFLGQHPSQSVSSVSGMDPHPRVSHLFLGWTPTPGCLICFWESTLQGVSSVSHWLPCVSNGTTLRYPRSPPQATKGEDVPVKISHNQHCWVCMGCHPRKY